MTIPAEGAAPPSLRAALLAQLYASAATLAAAGDIEGARGRL